MHSRSAGEPWPRGESLRCCRFLLSGEYCEYILGVASNEPKAAKIQNLLCSGLATDGGWLRELSAEADGAGR